METAPTSPALAPPAGKELRHYLHLLRKRWRVLAIAMIVGGAIAFVYTIHQPKIYEASCSLVLEERGPQILQGVQDVVELGSRSWSSWKPSSGSSARSRSPRAGFSNAQK